MPPDSTCERGRWFRDPCSSYDDAGEQQVSPLRLLRCAPVEMTVIGRIEGGCLGSHFSRRTREMGHPRFSWSVPHLFMPAGS